VGLSCAIPELLADPQFAASHFFREVAHPTTGVVQYPGPAFQVAGPSDLTRRAPSLGEDNARIYGGWLGLSRHECSRLCAQGVI
jgi:crotonobetainyl-CoA:carnitine CoA-transferase CaiB-like acyl-CoA transferase